MNIEQAKSKIEKKFKSIVEANQKISNAYLLIHSDKHNIHWNIAHGHTDNMTARAEQPYHTASVGKTFTAVIIAKLVEEGKINYDDSINKYLTNDIMKDLHVYKGTDYSQDICIKHLVNNTSGIPDFYESKPKNSTSFIETLLDDLSRVWTPQETIQWSKQYLSPRFIPGKRLHYSNTGYNLLGLIIENVTSKPFHDVLHEFLFSPLKMNHSYLSQYSKPTESNGFPIANLNIANREIKVEEFRSSTSVYAGGQTVSTSEDMLLFMKALVSNSLIQKESFSAMHQWHKMWPSIDYGYGLMRIRMIPFTQKYNVWGHLGSTGSFMLYNPAMDVYIIGSFNKTGLTAKGVRFIYSALRTLSKCKGSVYSEALSKTESIKR
jgi:D-alanyl-D-alanine carboxypeptidase